MENKLIFQLIPKIMKEIGAIAKNGDNEEDDYKFQRIDDVKNKLQPILARHGVFFVPNVIESTEEKFQKFQVRVKIRVRYLIFAQDGSSTEATVEGEAIDDSDKATNKAMTAAFKYMLIQVFCIAIKGMDDADSTSPKINAPTTVQHKQKGATAGKTTVQKTKQTQPLPSTNGPDRTPGHRPPDAPSCPKCDRGPMMVSLWLDRKIGHHPWWCQCGHKIPLTEAS